MALISWKEGRMPLYQHRFRGHNAAGDIWQFTWWSNSLRTTADANTAAVAWLNELWDPAGAALGLGSLVVAGVGADRVSTGRINPSTGLQDQLAEGTVALVGTAVGSSLPPDVALVVSLRTALANRRGRGRFYLPAMAASTLAADGRVATAAITTLVGALTAAWGPYTTGVDTVVVYSRTGRMDTTVSSFDIGNLFDTQRRRDNKIVEVRTSASMP